MTQRVPNIDVKQEGTSDSPLVTPNSSLEALQLKTRQDTALDPLEAVHADVTAFLTSLADVFGEALFWFEDELQQERSPDLRSKVRFLGRQLHFEQSMSTKCRIGFVGERGVGKTSLLNKLLGEDSLFPTNPNGTCTASVSEISSWENDNYNILIDFLPEEEATADLEIAYGILFGPSDGEPVSTEKLEELKKAWQILKALYPKANIVDLEKLLMRLGREKKFLPAEHQTLVSKRQVSVSFSDLKELKISLAKYTDFEGTYWPIVEKVVVRGPFHRRGLLSLGCVVLDIPGEGDGVTILGVRAAEAVQSCDYRFLVVRRAMFCTEKTASLVSELSSGSGTQFSIIVADRDDRAPHNFRRETEKTFQNLRSDWKGKRLPELPEGLPINLLPNYTSTDPALDSLHTNDYRKTMKLATDCVLGDIQRRADDLSRFLQKTKECLCAILSTSEKVRRYELRVTLDDDLKGIIRKNPEPKLDFGSMLEDCHPNSLRALFGGGGRIRYPFSLQLAKSTTRKIDVADFKNYLEKVETDIKNLPASCRALAEKIRANFEAEVANFLKEKNIRRIVITEFYSWAKTVSETRGRKLKYLLDQWLQQNHSKLVELVDREILKHLSSRLAPIWELGSMYQPSSIAGEDVVIRGELARLSKSGEILQVNTTDVPAGFKTLSTNRERQFTWKNIHTTADFLCEPMRQSVPYLMRSKPGFVYVLSNPAMPGLFKIGSTTGSVLERKLCLETTGVPAVFKIELECKVLTRVRTAEMIIHEIFKKTRYSSKREFFQVDLALIKQVVEVVCVTLQ